MASPCSASGEGGIVPGIRHFDHHGHQAQRWETATGGERGLVAPLVFKTSGTGDPCPVGSIPATSARNQRKRDRSDRQQVARPGVGGGMTQLRHRPGFDLADALAREVELLADLAECVLAFAADAEA